MGWLCDTTFSGNKADIKAELKYKILNGWRDYKTVIIKECFTSEAYFSLVNMYYKNTDMFKATFVSIQMYNLSDGLCVKDLEESAGPGVLASKEFVNYLNKHHSTTEEYALEWREKCLGIDVKSIALKTDGAIIRTHSDKIFDGIGTFNIFKVHYTRNGLQSKRRTTWFTAIDKNGVDIVRLALKISNLHPNDFSVCADKY